MHSCLGYQNLVCERLPHRLVGEAASLEDLAIDQVAFETEVVGDVGVDRCKLLDRLHLSESEHSPLYAAEQQVAVLHSVVEPARPPSQRSRFPGLRIAAGSDCKPSVMIF